MPCADVSYPTTRKIPMNYAESLQYILSFTNLAFMRHIPYSERTWNLDRIEALMDALDHPERAFPAVHIAGTKGKGSTAAMVESVLRQAGLRPGLYTSPHLHTFRERVRLDGQLIPRERWVALVERLRTVVPGLPLAPNTFDLLTALAFLYFAEEEVPVAVVEVGLGGRLDSTNVVHPALCVITTLGLEHTAILGPTIQHIAREKGGIIKPRVPVITAPQPAEALEVLETIAAEKEAPLVVVGQDWHYRLDGSTASGLRITVWQNGGAAYEDLYVGLRGAHQAVNAAVAVAAVHTLREQGWPIGEEHIRRGLAQVHWPARMELLQESPAILVDGAHTPESMTQLVRSLQRWFPERHVHVIFGVSHDKPVAELLDILWPHVDTLFITKSEHPRAATPDTIVQHLPAGPGPLVHTYPLAEDALAAALALADPEDVICACGSIFLAAAIREIWATRYGRLPADDWAYESDFAIVRRSAVEPHSGSVRR